MSRQQHSIPPTHGVPLWPSPSRPSDTTFDTCEADGKHLYAVQWINPRPEQQVRSVTLRAIEGPAQPLLAGLAIQARVE